MSAGTIAVAIIGIIVIVVVLLVILTMISTASNNEYCNNWSASIEEQRAQLNIFSDSDAFNREVSDYNRQCAY